MLHIGHMFRGHWMEGVCMMAEQAYYRVLSRCSLLMSFALITYSALWCLIPLLTIIDCPNTCIIDPFSFY